MLSPRPRRCNRGRANAATSAKREALRACPTRAIFASSSKYSAGAAAKVSSAERQLGKERAEDSYATEQSCMELDERNNCTVPAFEGRATRNDKVLKMLHRPPARRRWAIASLSYLLVFIGCLAIGVRLFRDSDRYKRQDFNRYYADATTLQKGGNPWHLFEPPSKESLEERQEGYPPAFYLMFSLFTRLRPEPAHCIWEALQIIALVTALIIVLREVGLTANSNSTRFAFAFAFLFPPLHSALHWGQPTPLLLLLLVASWASARRGWDITAGALLAAATLLKIFPWVVGGYFLFRRRWTVLASGLIFAVTVSLCLLALYGIHRNLDFLRGTLVSTIWLDRPRNLSVIGNLHALVLARAVAGWSPNAYVLGVLIALLSFSIVAISGISAWRVPEKPVTSSGLCWSLWVISSILLSPVAWDHYLVLVIPMYIFLAAQMTTDESTINQTNSWSYMLGTVLVAGGLLGYILAPYSAAARQARGYLILVLTSYVGLGLLLRQRYPALENLSPETTGPATEPTPTS